LLTYAAPDLSRAHTLEGPAAATGKGLARALVAATFLSGAAALTYQVLWTRELGLVLGHGVAAV
jgi:hypothetical protein